MPLIYINTFVCKHKEDLKWAVILTSVSTIPCLNSMLQGFSQRTTTKKGILHGEFLQQLRKCTSLSGGILLCAAAIRSRGKQKRRSDFPCNVLLN